jgi:hypothetical protein
VIHIATIAVGDYCAGAAALINSLACAGFNGRIIVGHQGPLEWDTKASSPVTCIELPGAGGRHSTNLKATLLGAVGSGDVVYVDSDCILTSPRLLEIVRDFLDTGAVFCVESLLPASDVRHHVWRRSLNQSAATSRNIDLASCVPYINAGFFGLRLPRDDYYLRGYSELMQRALPGTGQPFKTPYFPLVDQDCLNAVIANSGRPFATLGPPDIWYRALAGNSYSQIGVSTEPLLLHCTGLQKPWRLRRVPLLGPDVYDREFYRFAYVETPWVTLRKPMPKSIVRWIENGALTRARLKVRRLLARLMS